ncbi:uncharacterized protein [Haliotis asinina]|uniref:uncharacterized protein n=1 Tax=Haliotis asinina TaxID=109174 RepID=UPI0035327068
MFGRVIFLLYLPAVCFPYALFPNAGHKTQRRQNPENMENVSSSQGEEDSCMQLFSPCIHNLRPIFSIHDPKDIVVDGRLAVPCTSNILGESRNCIESVRQCRNHDFYKEMRTSQMRWDFICQNSQAFVSGEVCWRNSNLTSTIRTCRGFYVQLITCVPTCIGIMVADVSDCSTEEATLLGQLAEREHPC